MEVTRENITHLFSQRLEDLFKKGEQAEHYSTNECKIATLTFCFIHMTWTCSLIEFIVTL